MHTNTNANAGICFRTQAKVICDAVLEKPVSISAGKDDFEAILLASHRALGESLYAVYISIIASFFSFF